MFLRFSLPRSLLNVYIKTAYVLAQRECLVHDLIDLRSDADRRSGSKGEIEGVRYYKLTCCCTKLTRNDWVVFIVVHLLNRYTFAQKLKF